MAIKMPMKGMHKMPDGRMMRDDEMEKTMIGGAYSSAPKKKKVGKRIRRKK